MNTLTLRDHATTRVCFVVLFWAIAAIGVAAAHRVIGSPGVRVVVQIAVILGAASALTTLTSREPTIDRALFAGVAWALFSIIAEIVASTNLSHPWFELVGSPAHPLLRDLLLLTWIFAPSLFVRRR